MTDSINTSTTTCKANAMCDVLFDIKRHFKPAYKFRVTQTISKINIFWGLSNIFVKKIIHLNDEIYYYIVDN